MRLNLNAPGFPFFVRAGLVRGFVRGMGACAMGHVFGDIVFVVFELLGKFLGQFLCPGSEKILTKLNQEVDELPPRFARRQNPHFIKIRSCHPNSIF